MTTSISGPPGATAPPATGPSSNWSAGRVISLVIGALLALLSIGMLTGGGILLWADQTQRTGDYLTVASRPLSTSGYAVTSEGIQLQGADWAATSMLGRVRIQVTPADPAKPVFVGIAPAAAVQAYLAGSQYATVTGFTSAHGVTYDTTQGTAVPAAPLSRHIWSAQVSGTGPQTLTWTASGGSWMFVIMNANGSPGVSVSASAGATIPALTWIATGLLIAGAIFRGAAVVLLVIPVRLASRSRGPWQQTVPPTGPTPAG